MKVEIVKGEKKEFIIVISTSEGIRFDLTDYDQYKVCLPTPTGSLELTETPNSEGSVVSLNGSADKGELLALVNPSDSGNLRVGKNQELNLEVSSSSDLTLIKRWVIPSALDVVEFNC